MRRVVQGRAGMVLAFMLGLVIATAGTATAARLITGKQIKDGSVSTRDLSKGVRGLLAKSSAPGPAGPRGSRGEPGPVDRPRRRRPRRQLPGSDAAPAGRGEDRRPRRTGA